MSIETGNQLQDLSGDDIFGTVTCKECHTFWVKEFVPEFCTKCGTRVSVVRGKGCEELFAIAERGNITLKIVSCPHCGERYLKNGCPEKCFRCWYDLRSPGLAHWVIRKFRRLLRH